MNTHLEHYHEAVAFCESLLHPMTGGAGNAELRLHFRRMGYFLAHLGNPQERFASVHVAGTSGKGSTTAMIGAILTAAGLRTGIHCTPYLQTPIERMQVGDLYASPAEFAALVNEMRPHIAHMHMESPYGEVSYREVGVAQAFLYFSHVGVDIAAIETGMGGRYDYTNHIRPLVSVIVTVDYDHVRTLGPQLSKIARHKAGILKERTPAVTGVTRPVALSVIQREAQKRRAPLFRLGHEVTYQVQSLGADGSVFDLDSPWGFFSGLRVGMLGRHQVTNAALAVSAACLLRERGLPIDEAAIRQGIERARIPGRLEIVQRHPLVVLDGAHNPEKMRSLAAALRELFPRRSPVLVVGVLAAKQVDDTLAEVVPLAHTVVATTPLVSKKPAVPPDTLAEACRRMGGDVVVEPDVGAAIDIAQALAGDDGLVCVTGSLYMIGQARERWVPTDAVLAQRTSFPPNTTVQARI